MYDFALMMRLLVIGLLLGLAGHASGQVIPSPAAPDKIKAPTGEDVVLVAHASGSQIYVCQAGADGKLGWTLKAPEAELRNDQGAVIGRHFAGPTWKLNDGSEVTGKAAARVDSPYADSIPWLLVTVTGHAGEGALSQVSNIQRILRSRVPKARAAIPQTITFTDRRIEVHAAANMQQQRNT